MKLTIRFNKKSVYYILMIVLFGVYDFTILFQNYFGKIYSIVGVFAVLVAFYICYKVLRFNIYKTLLTILILSINSSYTSIFPVEYSSLPITWFLITTAMLIIVSFTRGISRNIYFFLSLFAIFYFVINLSWLKSNFINSLNQLINLVLFLLLLCCSGKIVSGIGFIKHRELTYIFFAEVLIYSLMIILSYVAFNNSGMVLGKIDLMNNRISYSATFGDYSFSTLYIVTAMMIIIMFIIKGQIEYNRIFLCGLLVIYLIGIIIVNARTGVFALGISTGIAILYESLILRNLRALSILPVVLIVGWILLRIILENRGGQELIDSSGRLEGYKIALDVFKEYPWLGTGFGVENYSAISHIAIPHNLFIQYLVQFGIMGFAAVLLVLIDIFSRLIKKRGVYKWALLTVFWGSMFIPDIISSHYLIVILILALGYEEPLNIVVERNTNESSRKTDL